VLFPFLHLQFFKLVLMLSFFLFKFWVLFSQPHKFFIFLLSQLLQSLMDGGLLELRDKEDGMLIGYFEGTEFRLFVVLLFGLYLLKFV